MRYFWGLLLVALGGAYLSASMGYIGYEQINQLWLWWPLILIFIGLDLVFKKFKYGWLAMVAFTLLAGILIYDISFAPVSYFSFGKDYKLKANEVEKTDISVEADKGALTTGVKIETGAVDFNILGKTDKVVLGSLESNLAKASVTNVLAGSVQEVAISTQSFGKHMMWLGNIKNKLTLALTDKLPIDLIVKSGASTLNMDLRDYVISGLNVEAGASTINIEIGEKIQNGAKVNIAAGASTIDLSVPKTVGVRLLSESGLTTNNFQSFTKNGDYYENDAYKTAEKKIDVTISSGASTITVKQK